MVDLHSHLLWNIDDGSKSKEMTINMLKQAIDGGTKSIVMTPHYISGYFETPINEIKKRVEELNQIVKEENLNINIYHGQEVYYTYDLLENLKKIYWNNK